MTAEISANTGEHLTGEQQHHCLPHTNRYHRRYGEGTTEVLFNILVEPFSETGNEGDNSEHPKFAMFDPSLLVLHHSPSVSSLQTVASV